MALPTEVNTQVTDSVTQTNVNVLEDAPAQAIGKTFDVLSETVSHSQANKNDAPATPQ